MSGKNYGIYRLETFQKRDGIQWHFEVMVREHEATRTIANSSRRPDYAGYSTKEEAKRGGLEWLTDYLKSQLQEVEEALKTL